METLFRKLCQTRTLLLAWKTVKQKGSSGGVDGVSIDEYDQDIGSHITQIQNELKSGDWKPQPYLRISIPKKEDEKRQLGLLCIKDKIVQQALKIILEPRFERVFVKNSFGYRPDKGHTKAIKFARFCLQNKQYPIILRLDIDNYFDNINHEILFRRLKPIIPDEEVLRLVRLCVQIGRVNKKFQWEEQSVGVAQGSVISPILANYYLHSFDQFVLSRTNMYVRYADDFIILCKNNEDAELLLKTCSDYLQNRLLLRLNDPVIGETKNGFEFLGVRLTNSSISISKEKQTKLEMRIRELSWVDTSFSKEGLKSLDGIHNYYAPLLPDYYLTLFDNILLGRLEEIIRSDWKVIKNKATLCMALKQICFFSEKNIMLNGQLKGDLVSLFLGEKSRETSKSADEKNRKLIKSRKAEYRRKENAATELVIGTYGTYIGVTSSGISLKVFGKKQADIPPTQNLKHITVISNGVSISSNAVGYCMDNQIAVDFFSPAGQHQGSILSNAFMSCSHWHRQVMMSRIKRCELAKKIISGKLKNQLNLVKYFHKYHKKQNMNLNETFDSFSMKIQENLTNLKNYRLADENEDYKEKIMSFEAVGAAAYWDYLKDLLLDDDIGFLRRERKGATDLFNCMLNYGYSILYARIWQSVLQRRLNPSEGMIHTSRNGSPAFVYDVIEMFRCQAVDRVVISLVQKKESLSIDNGRLSDETKKLLVANIVERLNRYEMYRGRECRLCDIISLQVRDIGDYISSDSTYRPYVAKW